jgi:hypothetical protein
MIALWHVNADRDLDREGIDLATRSRESILDCYFDMSMPCIISR